MILTNENLFLIVLGVIWIIGAVLQDLHRREVDNIWNFSLIAIALGYRAVLSVFIWDYWYFVNGMIGFGIFLILGNLFYYGRVFAGGDAKLVIALGTILPLSYSWAVNFKIFGLFIGGFLLGGSIYVFIWSLFLVVLNFGKFRSEFVKQYRKNNYIFLISFIFFIFWIVFSYLFGLQFVYIGIIFLLFPVLFIYAKSVEESCMIKSIYPKYLTEGDWLAEDVFLKGKKIKANWEGVSKKELKLIQDKYRRKILVKYGVPFTPAFLIGLLGVLFISRMFGLV
jgi:Flp pilus assembly protein protease CpaA